MTTGLVYLLVAFGIGLGALISRTYKPGVKYNFDTQKISELTHYANIVISAVEQEFKDSTLPKEEKDAARKARAIELMIIFAKQLNINVDPSLINLIGGLIESAIYAAKNQKAR